MCRVQKRCSVFLQISYLFCSPMSNAWECFPAALTVKGVCKRLDPCQSDGEVSTSMYLNSYDSYYKLGWIPLHTFKCPCSFINAYVGVCLPHSKLSIMRKEIMLYTSHTFPYGLWKIKKINKLNILMIIRITVIFTLCILFKLLLIAIFLTFGSLFFSWRTILHINMSIIQSI